MSAWVALYLYLAGTFLMFVILFRDEKRPASHLSAVFIWPLLVPLVAFEILWKRKKK
jgi:hypothetical protein